MRRVHPSRSLIAGSTVVEVPLTGLSLVRVDGVEGRATFFVDGRDVSMATGLHADFKLRAPVLIERRYKDGPMPCDGQIDDVRIYGRILSGEEISALAEEPATSK